MTRPPKVSMFAVIGLVLIAILGCSDKTTEPPPPDTPTLIIKWRWIETIGGEYPLNPQNQGYDMTLIFRADSTYAQYKDSDQIYWGNFSVGDKVLWFEDSMTVISLDMYLFDLAYSFRTADTLLLAEYFSGATNLSRWKRIKQ